MDSSCLSRVILVLVLPVCLQSCSFTLWLVKVVNEQKKTGRTLIFCQWWCRRSMKYTGGMGCLLLSPTSFITVILDYILREMSMKVPASMLGRRFWQGRGHYVSMICSVTAAQRSVCFETKPLFELLHSSQLASLPVGYRVMTDVRYVSSNFPKPSCGDTELAWRCQFAVSTSLAAGSFVPLQCPAPWAVLAELLGLTSPELLCKWCIGVIEKGIKCLAGGRVECLGGQDRGKWVNRIP